MNSSSNIQTCVCIHFLVGCKRPNCNFAHSVTEIKQRSCSYFKNCRNNDCKFLHINEKEMPKATLWKRGIMSHLDLSLNTKEKFVCKSSIVGFIPQAQEDVDKLISGTYEIPKPSLPAPKFVIEISRKEYEEDIYEDTNGTEISERLESVKLEHSEIDQAMRDEHLEIPARQGTFVPISTSTIQVEMEVTDENYKNIMNYMRSLGVNPIIISLTRKLV
jgi:hypothetical protein